MSTRTIARPGTGTDLPGIPVAGLDAHVWAGDACNAGIEIDPTPNPPDTTVNHLLDVEVITPDDIWAVGLARDPSTFEQFTLTLHYDGNAWAVVSSPTPPNAVGEHWAVLEDVHALGPNEVYAAGRREVGVSDAIGAGHDRQRSDRRAGAERAGAAHEQRPRYAARGHRACRGLYEQRFDACVGRRWRLYVDHFERACRGTLDSR